MSEPVLTGKAAIVTGASQGLGREIARQFLAAGADVALCARSAIDVESAAAALREEHPHRDVVAAPCDISRTEEFDRLFDAALTAFGKIDIMVNNAGTLGPIGPIDTLDWAAWRHAIAVNLDGTVYGCRRAVQHFKATLSNGRRKIINLSGGGATSPQPNLSAYGASKAGLVRFTETLAEEVKAYAIDVNALAPGMLNTRMLNELVAAGPEKIGKRDHERIVHSKEHDGAQMTQAGELAVFLASPASDGITGKLVSARWDNWEAWPAHVDELRGTDLYTLRRIIGRDRGTGWGDK